MRRHGSESFFVEGEGLLGETVGGRERTLAAALEAPGPAVSLLPDGAEGQPAASSPRRTARGSARPWRQAAAAASQIPAGFTYLGQFIDHDLTFDKTEVMLGERISPTQLAAGPLPEPRSRLALRRRAGRPRVGEVLRGRRHPPEDGKDRGRRAASPRWRASTSRAATGTTAAAKRKAIIPDPRNDENLAVAQTHLAFIRFHNRVVDTLPGVGARSTALRAGPRAIVTKHYQWMIRTDYLPRICAPGV